MRRKKKVPTLPNHITPVMPDFTYGADKFNNSCDVEQASSMGTGLAENMEKFNFDNLRMEIVTATIDYMTANGFEEDDARAYSDFEFVDDGDRFRCEVRGEFGLDEMGELSMILDPIVQRYDPDAYFDFVTTGILEAFVSKNISVVESLKRADRHNQFKSDLTGLFESTQNKLSARDKNKLADFVKNTDDVDEIETYLNGLLSKNESLLEYLDIDNTDELDRELEQYADECDRNIYDELPDWCKIYLDEFDGPWVHYGKLPSGVYFYTDTYDVTYFANIDDFLDDMRYGVKETQKEFKDWDADDYSLEFVNLMESDLDKVLN